MLIANLFWFHPLMWWLGARLIEERERACDRKRAERGQRSRDLHGGIVKVCRLYLHSPLACAAGVSGANLKQRMETIMENRTSLRLTAAKKSLLAAVAAAAITRARAEWAGEGLSDAAAPSSQMVQEKTCGTAPPPHAGCNRSCAIRQARGLLPDDGDRRLCHQPQRRSLLHGCDRPDTGRDVSRKREQILSQRPQRFTPHSSASRQTARAM